MIPFLTVLDKCQYIASFWMLFSIWERPCVQKEMIKPNSKYVHITGYSWIKYQEKIYSLGDHSGNGKVTILRRQKKLLKFWEDGHGQYILTETIVESLMSIQWRVLISIERTFYMCRPWKSVKVIFSFFGTMIGTGIYRSWFLSTEAISWNWAEKNISLYFFWPFTLWPQCI